MEYMIESSVTVHDDILQKELSSNANDKMKNIVMTIQREQNRIIRNEAAPVLIIQGVAGSGKTSIALHRIAYLLYAQRGQISSKDILLSHLIKCLPTTSPMSFRNLVKQLCRKPVWSKSYPQSSTININYQNFFEQVTEPTGKADFGFLRTDTI